MGCVHSDIQSVKQQQDLNGVGITAEKIQYNPSTAYSHIQNPQDFYCVDVQRGECLLLKLTLGAFPKDK